MKYADINSQQNDEHHMERAYVYIRAVDKKQHIIPTDKAFLGMIFGKMSDINISHLKRLDMKQMRINQLTKQTKERHTRYFFF